MQKRKHLTVRNLPADVAEELDRERRRRGTSLNQTVVTALRKGLGLGPERKSNGLRALAGTWSQDEFRQIEQILSELTEGVDEEVWR